MVYSNEIYTVEAYLDQADDQAQEAMDYSANGKAIKVLITACSALLRVVKDQQQQIEQLDKAVRDLRGGYE